MTETLSRREQRLANQPKKDDKLIKDGKIDTILKSTFIRVVYHLAEKTYAENDFPYMQAVEDACVILDIDVEDVKMYMDDNLTKHVAIEGLERGMLKKKYFDKETSKRRRNL